MRAITIVQGDLIRYRGTKYSVIACPPTCFEFILSSESDTCHLPIDDFHAARRNGEIEFLKERSNLLDTLTLKSYRLSPSLGPIYREMLASNAGQSATRVVNAIARARSDSVFGKLVEAGDIVIPNVRTLLRHGKKIRTVAAGSNTSV